MCKDCGYACPNRRRRDDRYVLICRDCGQCNGSHAAKHYTRRHSAMRGATRHANRTRHFDQIISRSFLSN